MLVVVVVVVVVLVVGVDSIVTTSHGVWDTVGVGQQHTEIVVPNPVSQLRLGTILKVHMDPFNGLGGFNVEPMLVGGEVVAR